MDKDLLYHVIRDGLIVYLHHFKLKILKINDLFVDIKRESLVDKIRKFRNSKHPVKKKQLIIKGVLK